MLRISFAVYIVEISFLCSQALTARHTMLPQLVPLYTMKCKNAIANLHFIANIIKIFLFFSKNQGLVPRLEGIRPSETEQNQACEGCNKAPEQLEGCNVYG